MDSKAKKTWTLTGLCCEFDIPFATGMSYRKGYTRIDPDVKVPGVSKKQFSPRQAIKFLVARRLFKAHILASVVQAFLDQVVDRYDLSDTEEDNWLVCYDPEDVKETMSFCNLSQYPEAKDLVQDVFNARWDWTIINLGAVTDELWGRIRANRECVDYKPKGIGQQVREALDAYFRSKQGVER
jgi:hypothetical protein